MIGLDVKMKKFFFDTLAVERRLGQTRARTLNKLGAYSRKVAMRSMRRVGKKGKPSAVGQPPRYHGGDPSLRTILYAMDPVSESVIIGPIKFNQKFYYGNHLRSGTIPSLHEVGGVLGIREKRVGTEWVPIGRRKPRPGQPTRRRDARFGPRPYMKPAQAKTIQKFPEVYYGSAAA